MAETCVFCDRIAGGDYGWEYGEAVGFPPLNPVTAGHFLIVPRMHVQDATDVPLVTAATAEAAASYARGLLADCNLITSVGPAATQTILHLHIHVVPRRPGDGLALPWTGQRKEGDR